MLSKFKNITFLIILITFIFIIVKYYFSEENIKFTNISRSTYSAMTNDNNDKLPVLKSDTNNIIVYKNDLEEFTKKRKKRFWEKLISN
tara:strand:+ start:865 stop:1128 length:264 start_codon:yes stop_codon:yes gene_type:complete